MKFKKLNIADLSNRGIFIVLFLYALLIRLPFFFRDYIDRDESSFIIMGQSWVDGHLPFTQLWDVKPPLTFLFFAILIYSFGKSFIAIRLAGTLLVAITAFFTYKLSKEQTPKRLAIYMALFCVMLQSLFGSLQGVMSEHIAMALLTPAIWLLTKKEKSYWRWLMIGLLVGCSLMVKLNLAYVALFVGLAAIYIEFKATKSIRSITHPILYGVGIVLIILLTFIPYYVNGNGMLWWKSVVEAPLAYAGARQYPPWKILAYLIPFLGMLWAGWKKKVFTLNNPMFFYLLAATLGTILAFIKSGRVNGHYLILIYPIILPLIAALASKLFFSYNKTILGITLIFLLVPMESYLEYFAIVRNKIENDSFFNGEGITVPQYFEKNNIRTSTIYFTEYHIGYWLMNNKPVTKAATQPSNVLKDEMFFAYDNPRETGEEELRYIMEVIKPGHIITRKNRRIFDKKEVIANFYINLQLLQNYQPLDTVDHAVIHQRLPIQ